MERRTNHAVNKLLSFGMSLIDEGLDFVEKCHLTRMNVFYPDTFNKLLSDHEGSV